MFLRRFQETVKKPSREWEKLFTIQISNEELIFIIHEELLQRTKEHFTHHRGEYLKAPHTQRGVVSVVIMNMQNKSPMRCPDTLNRIAIIKRPRIPSAGTDLN